MTADERFIGKIEKNLERLVAGRKPVVLVSTGSYNPIHLQHARMFYLARKVCAHAAPPRHEQRMPSHRLMLAFCMVLSMVSRVIVQLTACISLR
jgi:hypothetical protein